MHAELHIAVAPTDRQTSRLDSLWGGAGPLPSIESVVAAAQAAAPAQRWLLSGGEPTLRPDLPQLIGALSETSAHLGMRTDGLLLDRPGIDQQLHEAGLRFVRIPVHCGRADAHDWLARLPGANKRVRRALDQCTAGPLEVEAEVVLTRPTAAYLVETVSLLVRHGVNALHLRFLEQQGPAADDYIALAPRLGLLQPPLEEAIRQALRHSVGVRVEGVPLCAAPSFPECQLPASAVAWAIPEELPGPASLPTEATGCPGCPGPPRCSGPPAGYTALFGWTEVQSEGGLQARTHPVTPTPKPASGDPIPAPPGRAGRAPATRIRAAIRQAEQANIGGDPLAGRHPDPHAAQALSVEFEPHLPTRVLRMRMVRAAQHGAHTLRILGASLQHPEAHELIREAQRLSFQQVELCGDGHLIADWSDGEIFHLRGLSRVDLVFFGTDAAAHDSHTGLSGSFERSMLVAERVARIAHIPVGALPGTPEMTQALSQSDSSLPPLAPSSGAALAWTDESGGTSRRDPR